MPDALSLLKEHRPPVTHEPDVEALERILAAPAPARRRRSPRPRRILVAAGAAAAIAVAATPLLDDSPDVVARAAAALNDSDSILHFKATWHGPQPAHGTMEVWRTDGGRQERILSEGAELAEDADTRTWVAYEYARNQLRRATPEHFDAMRGQEPTGGVEAHAVIMPPNLMTDDLAALLERAQRGEDGVRMLPDTTVNGVPVHQILIEADVPQAPLKNLTTGEPLGPAGSVHVERIVSVDRETYLPVRVEERAAALERVTDYSDVERLPRTPANDAHLQMAPHPGAKEVVVGG